MKTTIVTIALLGTESTGKTQLSSAMATALAAQGHAAVVVPEWLRTWCDREGRTPWPDEQLAIAQTQAAQVDEAVRRLRCQASTRPAYVIADTSSLMTAIYSDWLFGDPSLYPMALAHQRAFDHTLVTGLDLPWIADGLQRDGPQVREPIDTLLRAKLAEGGVPYKVIYGVGEERVGNAMSAIGTSLLPEAPQNVSGWTWSCDKCSDPACEHRLFSRLLQECSPSPEEGRPMG